MVKNGNGLSYNKSYEIEKYTEKIKKLELKIEDWFRENIIVYKKIIRRFVCTVRTCNGYWTFWYNEDILGFAKKITNNHIS